MPEGKLETVEPDPAAAPISNDQTVNKTGSPEVKDDEPVVEPSTGAAAAEEVKEASDKPTAETFAKDTEVETEGHTAADKAAEEAPAGEKKEAEDEEQEGAALKRRRDDDGQKGGRQHKKAKRGTMFDPTVQDITDDPLAIRKQVEFYFSDANLSRDKFLFEKVEGSKNTPIDIKTIHSFKRMRRFQPYEAVLKALRESSLLEVTEDEKLKRKTALPADFENKTQEEIAKVVEDESMARSVYVKGFGYEKPSTQFDIEAWFSNYGSTNQVRLRRFDDRTFKGSVFAEFDSEETAKKFLALEPKPKYNDRDLLMQSKKQYCDDKVEAIRAGIIQPDGKGGYRKTDKAHKGERKGDERDWRERRDEDRKNGFKGRGGHRGGHRGHRGRGRGGGRGGYDRRDRRRDDDNGQSNDGNGEKQEQQATTEKKEQVNDSKAEAPKPAVESTA